MSKEETKKESNAQDIHAELQKMIYEFMKEKDVHPSVMHYMLGWEMQRIFDEFIETLMEIKNIGKNLTDVERTGSC